jgi:hypothetical protein
MSGPIGGHQRPRPKIGDSHHAERPLARLDHPRVWDDCQASRNRDAIYRYLTAVYDLVAWWSAEGREVQRARRALRLGRLEVSGKPFRRHHPLHGRPGQGRQANPEQVEPGSSVRARVQAGFRGPGPVHPSEGRHQRLRRSVFPWPRPKGFGQNRRIESGLGDRR